MDFGGSLSEYTGEWRYKFNESLRSVVSREKLASGPEGKYC